MSPQSAEVVVRDPQVFLPSMPAGFAGSAGAPGRAPAAGSSLGQLPAVTFPSVTPPGVGRVSARSTPRGGLAQAGRTAEKQAGAAANGEETKKIAEKLNDVLSVVNNKIRFKVVDDHIQVQIVDPKTNQVVKTLPPDKAEELFEHLDSLVGLVVDESA